MDIYHTTFEEARRTGKIQEFITHHWSSSDDSDTSSSQLSNDERPMTVWPRGETEPTAHGEGFSEMTAFLTKEHREKKALQKQEKIMSSANSSGSYLPLKESKALPGPIAPKLHHKKKLSELLKGQPNRQLDQSQNSKSTGRESLTAMKSLQTAMKTGEIERVVPPPFFPGNAGRMAPPRGPLVLPTAEPVAQKTKTASDKAVEYIEASADILDETRREITRKFRPPFEHLNHPSFPLSERASTSSSTSSYSFRCPGESDAERKGKPAKESQIERRLSGEGTDPWARKVDQDCRLCRKPGVGGMKGLCKVCEMEFMRPQTMRRSSSSSSCSDVKPTPPLKDRRTLSLRRDKKSGQLVSHLDKPRHKEGPRLAKNGSSNKPIVVTPLRQESQRCVIESADEYYDKVTRWQRKAQDDRTQDTLERWSKVYGSGHARDFAVGEDDGLAPLIPPKDTGYSRKPANRSTTFYGFWDDILQGHGNK